MSSTARSAQSSRRRVTAYGLGVGAATAALGLVMVAWALITPSLRPPDESAHLNSIIRLEYGGGWPAPGDARLTDVIVAAEREFVPTDTLAAADGGVVAWTVVDASTARTTSADAPVDQMTQHPPGYYAIQATVAKVAGLDGDTWREHLLVARLVSILLWLPVPALIAGAALQLTGSRAAAVLAALLPVGIPQVGFIGGAVSNDAGIALTGAVTMYLLARALASRVTWGLAASIGAALGAALLMKGFALIMVPVVIAGLLLAPKPAFAARLARTAVAAGVAFVVGGWWWALNLLRYGSLQPDGLQAAYELDEGAPRTTLAFAVEAAQRLEHSFIGYFGDLAHPVPDLVLNVIGFGLIALCVAGVIVARRRTAALVMLSLPVGIVLLLLAEVYPIYLEYGTLPGLQGRYLFIALVPLGVLIACAFAWLASRPVRGRIVAWVWGAVVAAVAVLGLAVEMWGYPADPDGQIAHSITLWRAWVPGGEWGVAVTVASTVLALAATLCAAACGSRLSGEVRHAEHPALEVS